MSESKTINKQPKTGAHGHVKQLKVAAIAAKYQKDWFKSNTGKVGGRRTFLPRECRRAP